MQWKSDFREPNYAPAQPATSPLSLNPLSPRAGKSALLVLGGVVLVLGLASLAAVVAGCTSRKTAAVITGKAVDPPVLRVAWPVGVETSLLTNFAATWAAQQAVKLEIVPYAKDTDLVAPLAADVCVIVPAELPRWAAGGNLLPVPEKVQKHPEFADTRLLPFYRQLLTWDRTRYALPLSGDALLCCYREDLFRDHAEAFQKQTGRALKPPETWEDFEAIARFFHDKFAAEGAPAACLPPLPANELDLERLFYAAAAPCARRGVPPNPDIKVPVEEALSFHFHLESGETRIHTPGFVHALRRLQRLQPFRPAQPTPEPANWFRDGKAVLCLADAVPWVPRFQGLDSPVRGRVGVCRVPGSREVFDFQTGQRRDAKQVNHVAYLGAVGWLGVVPRGAKEAERAFALLAWLAEPKVSADVVTDRACGGGPFRPSHLDSSNAGWHNLGLGPKTAELAQALRQTVEDPLVTNPVLRLRVPDERRFRQALAAGLRAALLEKKDANQALAEVAEAWRQRVKEKGLKQHRAEYRLSLGLQP